MQEKQAEAAAKKGIPTQAEQVLIQQGANFHKQGNLQEAEAHYRHVLATNPNQPDALHLMGVLAHQVQKNEFALSLITKSLAIRPGHVDTMMNLASVQQALGDVAKAEQTLNEAIKRHPNAAELWFNKGNLYELGRQHEKAIDAFTQGLKIRPEWPEAYVQLAVSYTSLHRVDEAVAALREALRIRPDYKPAITNLGTLLSDNGRHDEAVAHYEALLADEANASEIYLYNHLGVIHDNAMQWDKSMVMHEKALALDPENPDTLNNYANSLSAAGKKKESEELYKHALRVRPDDTRTYYNLGLLYLSMNDLLAAEAAYLRAIELGAGDASFVGSSSLYLSMGNLYVNMGNLPKALEYLRMAMEMDVGHHIAHSNYLFMMHYHPELSPDDIMKETRVWAHNYTAGVVPLTHEGHDRTPGRRMKLGFVSADFRDHPVNVYFEPILKSLNRQHVEIFCYNNNGIVDHVTKRLQSYGDEWHQIQLLDDARAAALIKQHGVDILIDLSGHTAGSRLRMFAHKPAPIQATWIGYFNSTGVPAIDYIITDRYLLPPEDEYLYTEKPLRLPTSGACYQLRGVEVEVNPLPALARGFTTFGCFSAISKITPSVLELWAEILKRVPTAQLYLKNAAFSQVMMHDKYREIFAGLGVNPERLRFGGQDDIKTYLAEYNEVDIMLDTFPYNAATTTLDALWMGVPPIALKGNMLVSHIGESMLGAVGLQECVAATKEEYVEKAVALAANATRLAEIRAGLRATLEASPMTDAKRFTVGLEDALRAVWTEWCEKE